MKVFTWRWAPNNSMILRDTPYLNTSKCDVNNDRYLRHVTLYWRYTDPPDIKEEEKVSLPTPVGYITK